MGIVCFWTKQQTRQSFFFFSNSLSVRSSYYSLWADDANYLLSYLSAHTKGNPQSSKWTTGPESTQTSGTLPVALMNPHFYSEKKQKKQCCHGYWQLLSSPFSFSSPLTISPSLSTPVASDSSIMHSCSLTGTAFWNYAGSCEAETIALMRCSRGAIMSLNKTGTARHLCALFLLQPNQEQIVFEGLVIKTPAVQLRLRVWLPLGLMNTFTSPSMSAPAAK